MSDPMNTLELKIIKELQIVAYVMTVIRAQLCQGTVPRTFRRIYFYCYIIRFVNLII